jgi:ABC-type ATPase involved in cell division
LYGSETWTIKARDTKRITAAEIKYMRRTVGYIWSAYKTNTQSAKKFKITPIKKSYWNIRETKCNM